MLIVDGEGDRAVLAPWIPTVGDYVRVEPGPECQAAHDRLITPPAYGRVEAIDRSYDDPESWVAAMRQDQERYPADPTWTSEAEARADAANERGHWYMVQDSLGGPKIARVDGMYAACELTRVEPREAIAAILAAHRHMASLTPDERLRRALLGEPR